MDSEDVIARRRRLREAARKVFDEFNMDSGVKKKRAAKTKTLMPAVKPTGCRVCGKPIEKTGKPGRPPTKCLEHR